MFKNHCKNSECCPVSFFILSSLCLSWFNISMFANAMPESKRFFSTDPFPWTQSLKISKPVSPKNISGYATGEANADFYWFSRIVKETGDFPCRLFCEKPWRRANGALKRMSYQRMSYHKKINIWLNLIFWKLMRW